MNQDKSRPQLVKIMLLMEEKYANSKSFTFNIQRKFKQ